LSSEQGQRTSRGRLAELAVTGAVALVLTLVLTRPLAARMGSDLTGAGDPVRVTWILAWSAHALGTDQAGLFDANSFYPARS
jgi:hypothetical protein